MAEQTSTPKKRGRKKGSTSSSTTKKAKRGPKSLENMTFEQLAELNNKITDMMKSKKDEQIKSLKEKLARLEQM